MSEIIKMYENAGVEPLYKRKIECKDGYKIGYPCDKGIACINCNRSVFEDVMPPFTPKKQLQLILFILNTFKQGFNCRVEGGKISLDTLARGIAQEVNNYWQDLTDAEKAQVKNILESEVRE